MTEKLEFILGPYVQDQANRLNAGGSDAVSLVFTQRYTGDAA
jgi:hypothetical protein